MITLQIEELKFVKKFCATIQAEYNNPYNSSIIYNCIKRLIGNTQKEVEDQAIQALNDMKNDIDAILEKYK